MLVGCLTMSNSPVREVFDVQQFGSPRAKQFLRLCTLCGTWHNACEGAVRWSSLWGLHMSTHTLGKHPISHTSIDNNMTAYDLTHINLNFIYA
jgi:hypothetical protein